MEKIYILQQKTDEETYTNNNLNQTGSFLMIIYISSNTEQIASRFYFRVLFLQNFDSGLWMMIIWFLVKYVL